MPPRKSLVDAGTGLPRHLRARTRLSARTNQPDTPASGCGEVPPAEESHDKQLYISLQHLNKLQLLNDIDEEVRTLNREHNRFLLSDTTTLLHKLVHEGDSSSYSKIGANITSNNDR